MAIFCIKIGENEPPTYPKYHLLSKHGDIIDILPKKIDKNGKHLPDDRSPGVMAEKEFLCLKVDLSHLTDEQRNTLVASLKMSEVDKETGATIRKRIHRIDIDNLPSLTLAEKTSITTMAENRRNKLAYSAKSINDKYITASSLVYDDLKPYIYNKIIDKNLIDFPLQENPVEAAYEYQKTGRTP